MNKDVLQPIPPALYGTTKELRKYAYMILLHEE